MKKMSPAIRFLVVAMSIAALLSFSACTTIRTTPRAFDTGRVLAPGEMRYSAATSMLFFIPVPGQIQIERGFAGGWEGSLGWGIHGIVTNDDDEDDETMAGPEIYIVKEILSYRDLLYLSLHGGSDMNVTPEFDALIRGGVSLGIFPVPGFGLFGNAALTYVTASEAVAPLGGAGIQVGRRFFLRLAGYVVPEQDGSDTGEFLWPFYYGLQVGFQTEP